MGPHCRYTLRFGLREPKPQRPKGLGVETASRKLPSLCTQRQRRERQKLLRLKERKANYLQRHKIHIYHGGCNSRSQYHAWSARILGLATYILRSMLELGEPD